MAERNPDAIVIGAGPNGLTAAIALARAGASALVVEAEDEVRGGTRTAELTLPGLGDRRLSSADADARRTASPMRSPALGPRKGTASPSRLELLLFCYAALVHHLFVPRISEEKSSECIETAR